MKKILYVVVIFLALFMIQCRKPQSHIIIDRETVSKSERLPIDTTLVDTTKIILK